jgi:hypothetical protein
MTKGTAAIIEALAIVDTTTRDLGDWLQRMADRALEAEASAELYELKAKLGLLRRQSRGDELRPLEPHEVVARLTTMLGDMRTQRMHVADQTGIAAADLAGLRAKYEGALDAERVHRERAEVAAAEGDDAAALARLTGALRKRGEAFDLEPHIRRQSEAVATLQNGLDQLDRRISAHEARLAEASSSSA